MKGTLAEQLAPHRHKFKEEKMEEFTPPTFANADGFATTKKVNANSGHSLIMQKSGFSNADGKDETLTEMRAYATIAIDNNPTALIRLLNDRGYKVPPMADRDTLGKMMMGLYKNNKNVFSDILEVLPYNEKANNYTTSNNFLEQTKQYIKQLKNK